MFKGSLILLIGLGVLPAGRGGWGGSGQVRRAEQPLFVHTNSAPCA